MTKIYITSDKNVFYEERHSDAAAHAKRNKLEIYSFKLKDLQQPKKQANKPKSKKDK